MSATVLTSESTDGADRFLDDAVESVNKTIDADMKAMMDAFDALVRLATIKDKDAFRIAQERFEAEARADVMVRSAQSLTLLSHALKLSLLLNQTPLGDTSDPVAADQVDLTKNLLDEEAKKLILSTCEHKRQCAVAIRKICGTYGTQQDDRSAPNDSAMGAG